jgi:hypothetical protein
VKTRNSDSPARCSHTADKLIGSASQDHQTRFDQSTPWYWDIACTGVDPELFTSQHRDDQLLALSYCAGCPVRRQCRDHMLAARPRPVSVIGGGWIWAASGKADPHPDDLDLWNQIYRAAKAASTPP